MGINWNLRKRGLIRVDARRSNWDGLQGGFCSKYRDICKKTNAADRPIRVIARRDELIRASLTLIAFSFTFYGYFQSSPAEVSDVETT